MRPILLSDKIRQAQEVLKLAAEMSETYYYKPLIIAYSGGKDSDVMLDIALTCLKPEQIEVVNSHTTVDAPETVYYIRDKFKKLNEMGIKTEIKMPRYKGKPTSMWKLIEEKGTFPTSLMRFCCSILKEQTTPNRIVAVGVRESESAKREGRDFFSLRAKTYADTKFLSADHVREQFESSKKISHELGDDAKPNAYDCKFIEGMKENKSAYCNPIYKFTEQDVWNYIHFKNIKVNPLYARGYRRVGCIGCPLAGVHQMKKQFEDYPKYRENYVKAFDRGLKKRRDKGLPVKKATTGEEMMRLWLHENPKQIRIEDLLQDATEK
jgi:phosphoadenosine phosphosulfate reductase